MREPSSEMSGVPATTESEYPVFLDVGLHVVFGIVTEPVGDPTGWGIVLLPGADRTPTTGRNRVYVHTAREWAALGHYVIRLDYRGVGESSGDLAYRLSDPDTEDAVAAAEHLRGECGVGKLLFVGTCFGGCAGVAAAARLPSVAGIAMLASPTRNEQEFTAPEAVGRLGRDLLKRAFRPHVWRGLLDPERNRVYANIVRRRLIFIGRRLRRRFRGESSGDNELANQRFVRDLELCTARGGRVLMLYGTEDREYADLLEARRGVLGQVLDKAGDAVHIELTDGEVHGHTSLDGQDAVSGRLDSWLAESTASPSPEPRTTTTHVWVRV